ncbi:hypothetical protein ACHAXR_007202, partial [Thalassiosira sp. AJA248-18]
MFAIIDKLLLTHTPTWYRSPTVQTVTLGIVFFWVFAAYTTIQFYSSSTYGASLAADSVSAVYLTFTLTCLVSPVIINLWGCRLSMFLGVLGYAALVLVSLIYFLYGGEDVLWARRLVVLGGAVLGCGASTLWTAQGRLILQYASRAEELEAFSSQIQNGEERKSNTQTGKLMGLFWAIFQCSSLVGGSISFVYYNRKPEGSTALYSVFLGFIIMGALFTQLLLPPSMLQNTHAKKVDQLKEKKDIEMISESTPLNADSGAEYERAESQTTNNEIVMCEDLSHQSWWQEAQGTLNMFFTKKMLYLSPLFFYTGFNQPYQQATFGNRFFTRRTIGAELIIFHAMEIIGAIVCGRFLDRQGKNTDADRRKRAIICLGAFVIINFTGNAFAFIQECAAKQAKQDNMDIQIDIADVRVISPSLAFACWGLADATIQVYCYWLMGGFYTSGSDHARAVG